MQIGNICRIKGIPLKVCMEALSARRDSLFFKDVSALSIKWKNAIHGPDTLIYVDFDRGRRSPLRPSSSPLTSLSSLRNNG